MTHKTLYKQYTSAVFKKLDEIGLSTEGFQFYFGIVDSFWLNSPSISNIYKFVEICDLYPFEKEKIITAFKDGKIHLLNEAIVKFIGGKSIEFQRICFKSDSVLIVPYVCDKISREVQDELNRIGNVAVYEGFTDKNVGA